MQRALAVDRRSLCVDLTDQCIGWKDLCSDSVMGENMQKTCPATCGAACDNQSPPTTTSPSTSVSCVDLTDECRQWRNLCHGSTMSGLVRTSCPQTCHVDCEPSGATTAAATTTTTTTTTTTETPLPVNSATVSCVDSSPDCPRWKHHCAGLSSLATNVRQMCLVTCEDDCTTNEKLTTERTTEMAPLSTEGPRPLAVNSETMSCVDFSPDCARWKNLCAGLSSLATNVRQMCLVTCEDDCTTNAQLSAARVADAASLSVNSATASCVDSSSDCPRWKQLCAGSSSLATTVRQMCPVTCEDDCTTNDKLTTERTSEMAPQNPILATVGPLVRCVDKDTRCSRWKTLCVGLPMSESLRDRCPVTCGLGLLCRMESVAGASTPAGPKAVSSGDAADEKRQKLVHTSTCVDQAPALCMQLKNMCTNSPLSMELQRMCPMTCGVDCRHDDNLPGSITNFPEAFTDLPESITDFPESITDFPETLADFSESFMTPATSDPLCVDLSRDCPQWKAMCTSPSLATHARKTCPVTCGTNCEGLLYYTLGAGPTADCVDLDAQWCPRQRQFCIGRSMSPQLRQFCPVTCGVNCGEAAAMTTTTTTPDDAATGWRLPRCVDMSDECAKLKHACSDPSHAAYMRQTCPETCGVECTDDDDLTLPPAAGETNELSVPPAGPLQGLLRKPLCMDFQPLLCLQWKHLCTDADVGLTVRETCPETCKVQCEAGTGTTTADTDVGPTAANSSLLCVDLTPYQCRKWKRLCTGSPVSVSLRKMCPVTCGVSCRNTGACMQYIVLYRQFNLS